MEGREKRFLQRVRKGRKKTKNPCRRWLDISPQESSGVQFVSYRLSELRGFHHKSFLSSWSLRLGGRR